MFTNYKLRNGFIEPVPEKNCNALKFCSFLIQGTRDSLFTPFGGNNKTSQKILFLQMIRIRFDLRRFFQRTELATAGHHCFLVMKVLVETGTVAVAQLEERPCSRRKFDSRWRLQVVRRNSDNRINLAKQVKRNKASIWLDWRRLA